MRALRLCILENGLVPEPLDACFSSYPAMIEAWLAPVLPEAEFHAVSPVSGEPLPDPAAFDGYLLTGSKHSVYEGAAWIRDEIEFLRRVREIGLPVFGICFGHQLMADAFGGKTEKAGSGWGFGLQEYTPMHGAPGAGAVLAFHQDQVTTLPPDSEVLAGTDQCPNGVLRYTFPALSVQYHPEFSTAYVEALLQRYAGDLFGNDEAASALQSLNDSRPENEAIASMVARFFRDNKVSIDPAPARAIQAS